MCQRGYVNTITQSYCLHLRKCKFGIFRCKISLYLCKMPCKKKKIFFYKSWYCPDYVHTSHSMLVQYPIVSILCFYTNTHSVYTVCLIEVYSILKCNNLTSNFGSSWHRVLLVIVSIKFQHLPSVLVMTYRFNH